LTLANLLQRVISVLEEAGVPYMLTGSLAAAYYAVPRATQDIHLVVEVSPEQLRHLTDLISSAGFYVSLAAAKEASAQEGQFNAIDPQSGWKVDFIIRKSRAFSQSEFERRVRTTALGLDLTMVTKEDIVVAKLEWAKKGESELQIRDVRAILGSAGPEFDWDYVGRWVSELGLEEQWGPLKSSVMDRRGTSDQD
jgi:hypothetical protein